MILLAHFPPIKIVGPGLNSSGKDPILSDREFAMLIADKFNYDRDLIIPVNSSEIDFKAQRPQNINLISGFTNKDIFSNKYSFLFGYEYQKSQNQY